jgi:hypothetical protein
MKEDNIFSSFGDASDFPELRKVIANLYPYVLKGHDLDVNKEPFSFVILDKERQAVYASNQEVLMATSVAIPDYFPSEAYIKPARFPKDVDIKNFETRDPNLASKPVAIIRNILSANTTKLTNGIDFDFLDQAVKVSRGKHLLKVKNNVLIAVYDDNKKIAGFVSHAHLQGINAARIHQDATFALADRMFFANFADSTFVCILYPVPEPDSLDISKLKSPQIGDEISELYFIDSHTLLDNLYVTQDNVDIFSQIENSREQRQAYPQAIQKNLSQLYALRVQGPHIGKYYYRRAVAFKCINRIIFYNDVRTIAIKRPGISIDHDEVYAVSQVPMDYIEDGPRYLPYDHNKFNIANFYHCTIDWDKSTDDDFPIGRVVNSTFHTDKHLSIVATAYKQIKNYLAKTKQLTDNQCYVEQYDERHAHLHVYTKNGDIVMSVLNKEDCNDTSQNSLQVLSPNSFYPHLYAAIATILNSLPIRAKDNFSLTEKVTFDSLHSVLSDLIARQDKLSLRDELVDAFQAIINLIPFAESEQAQELINLFTDNLNNIFLKEKQQESQGDNSQTKNKERITSLISAARHSSNMRKKFLESQNLTPLAGTDDNKNNSTPDDYSGFIKFTKKALNNPNFYKVFDCTPYASNRLRYEERHVKNVGQIDRYVITASAVRHLRNRHSDTFSKPDDYLKILRGLQWPTRVEENANKDGIEIIRTEGVKELAIIMTVSEQDDDDLELKTSFFKGEPEVPDDYSPQANVRNVAPRTLTANIIDIIEI